MTPRVVFDCMLFLQGAGRPAGPARQCFRLVDEERVILCTSAEILSEVRDVLNRPETQRKFPLLTSEWTHNFVKNVESKAMLLAGVPKSFTLPRDPKDEPYVDLAIAAGARYLVSRDKDLLDLMTEEAFRTRFPELTILDPVAFLQAIARDETVQSVPQQDSGPETTLG